MEKETTVEAPKPLLATQDWTLRELMDTERRFEKAFHEQTIFLKKETNEIKQEIGTQTRWMIGLMISTTLAILLAILAVLFKG